MTARRNDIQILRGLAVLAVVLYHAGLPAIAAGYLGVDIFFVVSGYLMMRIISAERDAGTFSVIGFYLRRARRLLPAAFATLLVTAIAAPFFLTQEALHSFGEQLVGALTFTANIVLWNQGGYFDIDPAQKPLLHFWSLSLEEQFYFLFPLLLLVVAVRRRLGVLAVLAAVSFALCWMIASRAPSLAFYLLPTRAWELLLGAAVAALMAQNPTLRLPSQAGLGGLGMILVVLIAPIDPVHPRIDALLATFGTAAIILCRDDWMRAGIIGRVLSHIGDISYSLYLVHWPLIAFASAAYLGEIPATTMAGLAVAAYLLALLQYRFVETPFRHLPARVAGWPFVRAGATAGLVLAAAVSAVAFTGHGEPPVRRANPGLDRSCDSTGPVYDPVAACRTSERPVVALWGDSFAMQWAKAIADMPGASAGLVQITRSACTPMIGLARTDYATTDPADCLAYNADVLTYLAASPTIDTVVMSGRFSRHLNPEGAPVLGPNGLQPPDFDATRRELLATVRTLLDAGKRVVIIAPAPANGVDIGDCQERIAAGLVTLGAAQPCGTSVADYLAFDAATIRLLSEVAAETGITVVWSGAAHCFDGFCSGMSGGALLYREISHLTYEGTARLAALLRLDEIAFGGRRCTPAPEDAWACAIEHPAWLPTL